jgi:hypothetical protein
MRELFTVMLTAVNQRSVRETILAADYRATRPIAVAEHFFYPHCADAAPRYRQNLLAVVTGHGKFILRRDGVTRSDSLDDPNEVAATRSDRWARHAAKRGRERSREGAHMCAGGRGGAVRPSGSRRG